jgi:hypothetical protein
MLLLIKKSCCNRRRMRTLTIYQDAIGGLINTHKSKVKIMQKVKTSETATVETNVAIAAPAPPKIRTTKAPQIVANSVPQPRAGTVGRAIWDLSDKVAAKTEGGYRAIRNAVVQEAADTFNPGNLRTELSLWKRFNGVI